MDMDAIRMASRLVELISLQMHRLRRWLNAEDVQTPDIITINDQEIDAIRARMREWKDDKPLVPVDHDVREIIRNTSVAIESVVVRKTNASSVSEQEVPATPSDDDGKSRNS